MLAECIGRYTRGFYLFREIGFLHAIIDSEKFVKKTREGLQFEVLLSFGDPPGFCTFRCYPCVICFFSKALCPVIKGFIIRM